MSISSEDTVILPKMAAQRSPVAPTTVRLAVQNNAISRGEIAALTAILALAAFLDFYHVTRAGLGNNYYAIGVKSMLMSWHNFFFVAFDPGGFISIDKPPLALWLQVFSAKIFGYNSFGLMLPEALSGVVSVWLLYRIVRRAFGAAPALLSAGLLAISPINVVANRDTILESPLVLVLLAATWAVLRAIEDGNWKWLSLAAVLIGLGFNIKMLEAYLVVPALWLVYLCGASTKSWQRRLLHLYLATMIMLTISFAWAAAVNLTPADQRPFVGSTTNNSVIDLIFNHNGLARYNAAGGQAPQSTGGTGIVAIITAPLAIFNPTSPHQDQGYPGPFRLIQPELGGQAGWFVPLALLGLLSTIWQVRPRAWRQPGTWRTLAATEQQFVLWTVWFLVMAYFFSFASHINPYYMTILTPAIAALAGIGLVGLWRDFGARSWRGSLLVWTLVASLAEQFIILRVYPPVSPQLALYEVLLGILVVACLIFSWLGVRYAASRSPGGSRATPGQVSPTRQSGQRASDALVLGIITMLLCLAPALWTFASLRTVNAGEFPLAGTGRQGDRLLQPPHAEPHLLAYLQQNAPHTFFLLGTLNVVPAEGVINDTGAPVMAFGGWGGGDQTVTPQTLAALISQHQIRYFLLPSANLDAAQAVALYPHVTAFTQYYDTWVTQWIGQHCLPLPPELWSASNATTTTINPLQLFDCGTQQTA